MKDGPRVIPELQMCTVELSLIDMLSVGHSLRALAKAGKPNAETASIYWRVGCSMVDAANVKIAERDGEQAKARAEFIEHATAPNGGGR